MHFGSSLQIVIKSRIQLKGLVLYREPDPETEKRIQGKGGQTLKKRKKIKRKRGGNGEKEITDLCLLRQPDS